MKKLRHDSRVGATPMVSRCDADRVIEVSNMSRVAKRRTYSVLGGVLLFALVYLALPVSAGVEAASTPDVLCSKSTREGVILAPCGEASFFASIVGSDRFLGAESNFRDPLY